MKRTKTQTKGSAKDGPVDFWAKPVAPEKTYEEAMEGKTDDDFKPWAMNVRFAKGDLLSHPKFGKGVVTEAEAGRVEIMFADGKKKLGHGQP